MFQGAGNRRAARDKYRGLLSTLERIEDSVPHPHRNHGGVFKNLKNPLPVRPFGYYREYVHQEAGLWWALPAGLERLILGAGGEVYFTPDHYETFLDLS